MKDIHDWDDDMAHAGRDRVCPECGSADVKFAAHTKATRGLDFSTHCNTCGNEESGLNEDLSDVMERWHLLADSPFNKARRT